MKGVFITSGSSETKDSLDYKAINYYKGTSNYTKFFKRSLESVSNTQKVDTFIITKEFGLVQENQKMKNCERKGYRPNKINRELQEIIPSYDYGVVLLSKDFFLDIFCPNKENDLMKKFSEGSLWGIFTAQLALEKIDNSLVQERELDLFTEKKVGVARYTNPFKQGFKKKLTEL